MTPAAGGDPDDQVTRWALAAGRGDPDAAAAFVRATQRQVWRFLQHLAAPGEVEDLAQETYLRALRSLPGFAGRSSARTWLYTIARRVAVDHVRAAVARPRRARVDDWQGAADAATLAQRPRFVGVGYAAQAIRTIFPQAYDVATDMVVTEDGIVTPDRAPA